MSSGTSTDLSLGVDARGLYATGIGRYIREVVARLLVDTRFRQITLLGNPEELHDFATTHADAGRARVLPYAASWFSRRTQTAWLSLWRRRELQADLWFFPFGDVPLIAHPKRTVVTVHDLIGSKLPEMSSFRYRLATGIQLHASVRRARRVIAVSEATRRDIIDRIPSSAPKTVVVHQGVGDQFRPLGNEERLLPLAAELCPFLLCVGNRYPHKNQVRAVEALAQLQGTLPHLRLVFAGGRTSPAWSAILTRAQALGVADRLVDLGDVTDRELRHLYAGCEALVFPSLYEGFGLPVLEAMACGAPVIASDRSSLPEVVGDAGVLVDPHDPAAIAVAVHRLAREPEFRASLARKGLGRAAHFTWSSTAKRTADIIFSGGAPDQP